VKLSAPEYEQLQMRNSRAKGKARLAGLLLRLLGAIAVIMALVGGCPDGDDQKGKPPNEGEPQDPCEGVQIKTVKLEVDMSPSVDDLDDWLDISYGGKLRKAFRNCCTEFEPIRATPDTSVVDYPENYYDCYDKGYDSWDSGFNASMHLILAKEIEDKLVFGYTPTFGQASPNGSSWVFVQRIDEFITDGGSYASRRLFGTREATHELGHHRSTFIENACEGQDGEWRVSPWHHDEEGNADGDCVMASPYVKQNNVGVYSLCGTGKNLLDEMYFCYDCRETIKYVSW
jgi:hypothetical protein